RTGVARGLPERPARRKRQCGNDRQQSKCFRFHGFSFGWTNKGRRLDRAPPHDTVLDYFVRLVEVPVELPLEPDVPVEPVVPPVPDAPLVPDVLPEPEGEPLELLMLLPELPKPLVPARVAPLPDVEPVSFWP